MTILEGDLSNLTLEDFSMDIDPHSDSEAVVEELVRDRLQEEVENNWRTQEEADQILYRFHADRLMHLGHLSVQAS